MSQTSSDNEYTIEIKIDDTKLKYLLENNFCLCCFRVVSSSSNGTPLVWIVDKDLFKVIRITWNALYGAYISKRQDQICLNYKASFEGRTDLKINLGQIIVVNDKGLLSSPTSNGTKGAITISNENPNCYTCGISEYAGKNESGDDIFNPFCRFPLLSNSQNIITPTKKIALMFTSRKIEPANEIDEKAPSSGIIVDLSASNKRTVTYDETGGWSADNLGESSTFASNSDMSLLLIT
jgi:hypothetical protein